MALLRSRIEQKICAALLPTHFLVKNESHLHAAHAGLGSGETHFRIEIVSQSFVGLSPLQRHRLVSDLLSQELSEVKAYSLHTKTPDEWEALGGRLPDSPRCVNQKPV